MDIRLIRENPDEARRILALRRCPVDIDRLMELDARRKQLTHERDAVRFRQRQVSEAVRRAKKETRPCEQEVARARALADIAKRLEAEVADIDREQAAVTAQYRPSLSYGHRGDCRGMGGKA